MIPTEEMKYIKENKGLINALKRYNIEQYYKFMDNIKDKVKKDNIKDEVKKQTEINKLIKIKWGIAKMINKITTYIKHKKHNIKMMFKLFRNAWKLNSIITWYEQYQTLPNQIRDIKDNINDIDYKCDDIETKCDDNYYKIEDIETKCDDIKTKCDDIDNYCSDIEIKLFREIKELRDLHQFNKDKINGLNELTKRRINLKTKGLEDEIKKLKTSNNDDDNYLYKPLKFKGNEGYYEWLTNKTNHDNLDKCAEEIARVYGGDVNNEDINNIRKIISKYINLTNKGGE